MTLDQRVPEFEYDPGRSHEIMGECQHCHLPVYRADERELLSLPPGTERAYYHGGCAYRAKVKYWSDRAQIAARELRSLRCEVRFELHIPVS